jgi:hypothetical protein
MIYNWNILNTAQQQTPVKLWKEPFISWLKALLAPVMQLYASQITWYRAQAKLATYTVQTCKLQAMLNDLYDPQHRRIVINNQWYIEQLPYEGQPTETPISYEGQPSETPISYEGQVSEYLGNGDFTVICAPGSLTAQQQKQIKATTNKYRFAGTFPCYMYSDGVYF